MGGGARLQGRSDSDLGRSPFRSREGGLLERPIARSSPESRRATASRSPSFPPICRASLSRCTRPTTTLSTPSRRQDVHGNPAERQKWAVEQMMLAAKASKRLGLKAHATFSGALAWPYVYPWPQRPPGLIETAFEELAKRWKPILDAFDEAGCDVCLRDPSGRGPARRRDLRALSRGAERPQALQHPLRSVPLRAAAARLSRVHRHLSRAHQGLPRQGRRVQPDRPSGRLFRLRALGRARGAVPFARRRAGRLRRHLLEAGAIRLFVAGRCWNGSAASSIRRTARAKAPNSSSTTSSG